MPLLASDAEPFCTAEGTKIICRVSVLLKICLQAILVLLAGHSWVGLTCLKKMTTASKDSGRMTVGLGMPWPWAWMWTSLLPPHLGTGGKQKGGEAERAGTASQAVVMVSPC